MSMSHGLGLGLTHLRNQGGARLWLLLACIWSDGGVWDDDAVWRDTP